MDVYLHYVEDSIAAITVLCGYEHDSTLINNGQHDLDSLVSIYALKYGEPECNLMKPTQNNEKMNFLETPAELRKRVNSFTWTYANCLLNIKETRGGTMVTYMDRKLERLQQQLEEEESRRIAEQKRRIAEAEQAKMEKLQKQLEAEQKRKDAERKRKEENHRKALKQI